MPRNILLITSDQQHFSTLGVTNPRIRTPALDRLAAEGTRYERAYCCNPVSSPSRASIITGLYPSQHGCWTIGVMLPTDVPTVGGLLSAAGYATTLIGKAHFQPTRRDAENPSVECHPLLRDLDFWRRYQGPFYGFDHIEICRNHGDEHMVGQHYAVWMEEQGFTQWREHYRKWPPEPDEVRRRGSWDLPEQYHYTRWTGERTIAALERSAREERPFLLWSSFHDPHPPYLVPEPWASMYDPAEMEPGTLTPGEHDRNPPHFRLTQQEQPDFSAWRETEWGNHGFSSHLQDRDSLKRDLAIYYGMVSFVDREIGRILDAVDRLNLAANTLVVFTTDHGHLLGQHGLNAKGAFHYEDLIRVPMIVRCPEQETRGAVSQSLQSLVDYAPSFLDAAGLPVPGAMTGLSQLAVWRGDEPARRDHVLVENRHQPTKLHLRTYVDERYKITVYRGAEYGELFDLEADPGEVRNLWDDPAAAPRKAELLRRFVNAEMAREPTRMSRIAGA